MEDLFKLKRELSGINANHDELERSIRKTSINLDLLKAEFSLNQIERRKALTK